MALSINPLAKLVTSVSQQVASAANTAQSSLQGEQFASLKQQVNDTVSRVSGGIGSGLNGFTASARDGLANATSSLNGAASALGGAATALGGAGNPIQSLASRAVTSASEVTGVVSNVSAQIGSTLNKLGLGQGGLGSGLINVAAGISAAAGQINNLLSLARGKNIPSGAELFNQTGAMVEVQPGNAEDWRIKLNCNWGLFGGAFSRLEQTGGMVWPYLPNITFSTRANYSNIEPVHNNYPFMAYKNSQVEDIQISGEFSVETELDAEYWIQSTTFLRTATKMFFGTGQFAGNPPIICRLSGYGTRIFHNVPVIVKSFSVDFKEDVNYMRYGKEGSPTWVPILSTISATLSPIYNRTRLRQFNLKEFAEGKAVGFI
jgi:hypothetical protein